MHVCIMARICAAGAAARCDDIDIKDERQAGDLLPSVGTSVSISVHFAVNLPCESVRRSREVDWDSRRLGKTPLGERCG